MMTDDIMNSEQVDEMNNFDFDKTLNSVRMSGNSD